MIVAEIGSLSLEFTRLSQVSGNPKFYDAIQRITETFRVQQQMTKLPGMWPVVFDAMHGDSTMWGEFSLGAMSDSLYEYLPKQYLLLGGLRDEYKKMYVDAIKTAKQKLFFRPMTPGNEDILVSSTLSVHENGIIENADGQHLVCFAGGMLGIGAKIFGLSEDLEIAQKLTRGCIWAYKAVPQGIMPETYTMIRCGDECVWNETRWKEAAFVRAVNFEGDADQFVVETRLPPGFIDIPNPSYILRPEAIESVFILYRITGDADLLKSAWSMFQAIEKHTRTEIAHASLADVTQPEPSQMDKMESFWTAETLKYFYLTFSEPNFISLDDYVFNTEAHPFRRPRA